MDQKSEPKTPWESWPELPPPDITALVRSIQALWLNEMRQMECALRDDWRDGIAEGRLPEYRVTINHGAALYQRIVELVTAYDFGRTEHLKWLQEELIRMHNRHIGPIFMPAPEKD
jgi:hypothetical protein